MKSIQAEDSSADL